MLHTSLKLLGDGSHRQYLSVFYCYIHLSGVYLELKVKKKRTNIYLRGDQVKRLKAVAERRGSSAAELVRQAVDAFLEKVDAKVLNKRKRSK